MGGGYQQRQECAWREHRLDTETQTNQFCLILSVAPKQRDRRTHKCHPRQGLFPAACASLEERGERRIESGTALLGGNAFFLVWLALSELSY